MKTRNHNNCLVLNTDYAPIAIISWQRAITWSYKYAYIKNPTLEVVEYYLEDFIVGTNGNVKLPAVLKTNRYIKTNNHHVNFSRKNLFIRDDHTCQYCNKKLSINQLTYDHVIPKSKWTHPEQSATSWTNIVTACYDCNRKKGNKNIDQINMNLRVKPFVPSKTYKYLHVTHHLLTIRNNIPEEWKLYTNNILTDANI
jgi:5-methylcytosine-specific restriction endonuclease McrA